MKKAVFCIIILALTIGSISAQPRLWNIDKLNKASLENPALVAQIVTDADKLLKKKIASVVEKEKPAPSGDMHDYVSCAPYYWPDPANPGGPYIRRDGESNKAVLTPDKKNMGSLIYGVVQLSEDGRCIAGALEYLSQFVGKPKSAFPYKQISDWDGAQKNLILQLYRADRLSIKNQFEKYYSGSIKNLSTSNTFILF
jgi:Alginate lyase